MESKPSTKRAGRRQSSLFDAPASRSKTGRSKRKPLARGKNASGLARGISDHLTFRVTGPTEPLKLTLVFTDPPGALMAASAAVNDLDLELISPAGMRYRGNVFDAEQGASIPGGQGLQSCSLDIAEPVYWSISGISSSTSIASTYSA